LKLLFPYFRGLLDITNTKNNFATISGGTGNNYGVKVIVNRNAVLKSDPLNGENDVTQTRPVITFFA